MLIYLTYGDGQAQTQGLWDVIIEGSEWGCPEQVPLMDYQQRVAQSATTVGGSLVVKNVRITAQPTIIVLRKRR